jgi:hypothetical protein
MVLNPLVPLVRHPTLARLYNFEHFRDIIRPAGETWQNHVFQWVNHSCCKIAITLIDKPERKWLVGLLPHLLPPKKKRPNYFELGRPASVFPCCTNIMPPLATEVCSKLHTAFPGVNTAYFSEAMTIALRKREPPLQFALHRHYAH